MAVLAGSNNTTGFTTEFSINTLSGERWVGEELVASQSGTATALYVYVSSANDPNAKLTLRDSSGNELFTSAATAVPAGPGAWFSVALPNIAITSGLTYYGMATTDGGLNGRFGVMTNDTFGNYISDDGSYASPPASMTITEDGGNNHSLWYIDGTVGGGGTPRNMLLLGVG